MDLMPEASSAPPAVRARYRNRSLSAALIFLFCYLGGRILADEMDNPLPGQLIATLGVFSLGWLLYEFGLLLSKLDELQQRIHLTALAAGFGAALTIICLTGLIAGVIYGAGDPRQVAMVSDWIMIIASITLPIGLVAYYVALHFVKRRYR